MPFSTCLVVILGGAIGTLGRFLMGHATRHLSQDFPWGTMIGINVLGSFVIGLFGTLTIADGRFPVSENLRLFVMVGICGGYTTFSSFSLQTFELLRSGAWEKGLLNVILSCILSVAGVAFGHVIASHFNQHAVAIVQNETEWDA